MKTPKFLTRVKSYYLFLKKIKYLLENKNHKNTEILRVKSYYLLKKKKKNIVKRYIKIKTTFSHNL